MGPKARRQAAPSSWTDGDPFTYFTDEPAAASSAFRSLDWPPSQETNFSPHHVVNPAAASSFFSEFPFESRPGPHWTGYTGSHTGPFGGHGPWMTGSHTGEPFSGATAINPSFTTSPTITNAAVVAASGQSSSSPTALLVTNPDDSTSHQLSTGQLIAAIVFPILILVALSFVCFFIFLVRKKKKQAAAAQQQERGDLLGPNSRAAVHAGPEMLPAYYQQSAAPFGAMPQRHASISSGYYTGIDTAALAANAQPLPHGLEEPPPPPYRPRSLAREQRESGDLLRETPSSGNGNGTATQGEQQHAGTGTGTGTGNEPRRDDWDAVSDISDTHLHDGENPFRSADDAVSVVSDISLEGGRESSTHHVV
ncbi:hypothetical protein L228DRAFT_237036 [Xylona heveae TC161]|uniref:Uncharacterized protein n=1 Tax=Xylona heveae (strain CBS 132557 / TC161) TaxID=1328760 RepID=A0A165HXP7_XYLHT|nr:hypothetical protein L228DRAFT_237036 [Xylona heveae TC161]KZF24071.1 hypothetical protein L228DRAFT_237036 [Xylona heveae TC161]